MILTGETEVLREIHYTASAVDEVLGEKHYTSLVVNE